MGQGSDANRTDSARGIGGRGINRLRGNAEVERFLKRTRAEIDAAERAGQRPPRRKLLDGGGLFLAVSPVTGRALWRLKFRLAAKDSLLALGEYPSVGLDDVRRKRDDAKSLLAEGRNPVLEKQIRRASAVAASDTTLNAVADAWLAAIRSSWKESHYATTVHRIDKHLRSSVGSLPIATLGEKPVLLQSLVIEPLLKRETYDTATKVRFIVRGIFRYARSQGQYAGPNPADDLFLPPRRYKGRRPALLEWHELGDILRRAGAANLSQSVHRAHRLIAFTAVRIANAISAEWSEFNLDSTPARWVIPRAKMKAQDRDFPFTVILGPTIAEELRAWLRVTGERRWLFAAPRDAGEHISPESIEKVYRVTLGLRRKHSPHGWRSAFSTLAKESEGKFDKDAVNMALDHVHDTEVARRYDRGERFPERVRLAAWWDAQLVAAERGAP